MIWLDFVVVYDPQDLRSKSLKYFTNSTPFSNVGITLLHLLLKMYFLNSSMQVFIHSSSWPVNMLNTKYSGSKLIFMFKLLLTLLANLIQIFLTWIHSNKWCSIVSFVSLQKVHNSVSLILNFISMSLVYRILLFILYWKVLIEVSSVNLAVLRLISFQISLLKFLWSFSSHFCWLFIELGSSFSTWIFVKYFVTFKWFFRYVIWDEDTSSNLLQSFSFNFHSLGMALSSP